MNVIGGSASFYKAFFTEELYYTDKNKSTGLQAKAEMVSEPSPSYKPLHECFEKITSDTLLLFHYPVATGIVPFDKLFLNQVLKAVGLTFDTVSRLNTAMVSSQVTWNDIVAQSPARIVLSFGVDKKFMPVGIEPGEPGTADGRRVLFVPGLSEVSASNPLKKQLWQGMKKIYRL